MLPHALAYIQQVFSAAGKPVPRIICFGESALAEDEDEICELDEETYHLDHYRNRHRWPYS